MSEVSASYEDCTDRTQDSSDKSFKVESASVPSVRLSRKGNLLTREFSCSRPSQSAQHFEVQASQGTFDICMAENTEEVITCKSSERPALDFRRFWKYYSNKWCFHWEKIQRRTREFSLSEVWKVHLGKVQICVGYFSLYNKTEINI